MEIWEGDWIFLENAVESLKEYLLADELFWPLLSGKRLTLGNMRLSQRKLSCYDLPDEIQVKKSEKDSMIAEIFSQWRSNWSKKAEKEFLARFRQWEHFLKEISSNKEQHGLIYSHEVTWRVLLETLKDEIINPLEIEFIQLQQYDIRLKALLKPGEFIWDDALMKAFPKNPFWFLYGHV